MMFAKCYKCGKIKLVSFNRILDSDKGLTQKDLEGYQMTYGKNRGLFRCRDCKADSKFKNKEVGFSK